MGGKLALSGTLIVALHPNASQLHRVLSNVQSRLLYPAAGVSHQGQGRGQTQPGQFPPRVAHF